MTAAVRLPYCPGMRHAVASARRPVRRLRAGPHRRRRARRRRAARRARQHPSARQAEAERAVAPYRRARRARRRPVPSELLQSRASAGCRDGTSVTTPPESAKRDSAPVRTRRWPPRAARASSRAARARRRGRASARARAVPRLGWWTAGGTGMSAGKALNKPPPHITRGRGALSRARAELFSRARGWADGASQPARGLARRRRRSRALPARYPHALFCGRGRSRGSPIAHSSQAIY